MKDDELTLEVTLAGFAVDGEQLTGKGGPRDLMAMPLFNEGIRRITFTPNLPPKDRDAFVDAWLGVVLNPQGSEAVSTRLWELELTTISLVVLDTFALESDGATQEGASTQVGARAELDALISAMAAEYSGSSAPDALRAAAGPALLRVSADDLALLRSELVRGVSGEQLAQQDRGGDAAALHLSPTDVENFTEQLAPPPNTTALAAHALLNAAVLTQGPEADALATRLLEVLRGAADAGHFTAALEAYRKLVADARLDAQLGQARV